jgi:hypothetical protein
MPKQENANEDVELHAYIDGGDILNFTYNNLSPHPSSQNERMGGVFFVKIVITMPSLIVVFKPLPHRPSPCDKVAGNFFCSKSLRNTLKLHKLYCFF